MAQTLSYPARVKDCYHKLLFTNDNETLKLTNQSTLNDYTLTKIGSLTDVGFASSNNASFTLYTDPSTDGLHLKSTTGAVDSGMFIISDGSTSKISLNGDGSIELFNNTSLGTAVTGKIKLKSNKLYIGV